MSDDWIKIKAYFLESDDIQAAIAVAPSAVPTAIWALCRAGQKRSSSYSYDSTTQAGAARKIGIAIEELEAGLDALARVGFIVKSKTRISIPNWEKYQSVYMRRKEQKESKPSPTPQGASPPPASPPSPTAQPIPQPTPQRNAPDGEQSDVEQILDTWKSKIQKSDASASDARKWIARRLGTRPQGKPPVIRYTLAELLRAIDNYAAEIAAKGQVDRLYAVRNFFGSMNYVVTYAAPDWTAPKKTGAALNVPRPRKAETEKPPPEPKEKLQRDKMNQWEEAFATINVMDGPGVYLKDVEYLGATLDGVAWFCAPTKWQASSAERDFCDWIESILGCAEVCFTWRPEENGEHDEF